VIGTGASWVQIAPALAPEVARLDVYQRTPVWCLPKPDFRVPPQVQRVLGIPGVGAALHGYGPGNMAHYLTVQNRGLRTYYVNSQGDTPYLRPSTVLQARTASRRFPLEDYAYSTVRASAAADDVRQTVRSAA
jgi:hypothetical protein